MTTFEIPTVTTERLRLRAFRASDLDAYAAMQANPEVMRYLVMGRTSTPAEVWRTMASSLGGWALRGYGMWACEKNRRWRFHRQRRHLPAARLARTGTCLRTRPALLATGLRDRSSQGGPRLVLRSFPLSANCQLYTASE